MVRVLAGRYRLDSEIGRGAMGTVWNAFDEVLRRRVAIKEVTLPAGMPPGEAEQLADRTLREARAIAALSHPHVVTLFDILTPDSGPVIVMELMLARSLADILSDGHRLHDVEAAAIGEAIADGLTAAHAAGITHRDVKPANVLVADDGRIKLTDFGIARSAGEQTLTATGMLLGSPAYISPEVAAGRPATPAADAWGLGALLYAAVEGHPPFDRGRPIETLSAVVADPVPPYPSAGRIAPVIEGLLVKDPRLRMTIPHAHRMLAAVANGAVFQPPPAVSATPTAAERTAPSGARRGDPSDAADAAAPVIGRASVAGARSARPDLPPPPWAADAAAGLRPLPDAAPPRRRILLAVTAAVVGLLAVAAGYVGVLLIARLG